MTNEYRCPECGFPTSAEGLVRHMHTIHDDTSFSLGDVVDHHREQPDDADAKHSDIIV